MPRISHRGVRSVFIIAYCALFASARCTSQAPPHPDPYMMSESTRDHGARWLRTHPDQSSEGSGRDCPIQRENGLKVPWEVVPPEDRYKANRLFTLQAPTPQAREEDPMRYYIGVDWADEEDAVWVVDDAGDQVLSRRVAHTVA